MLHVAWTQDTVSIVLFNVTPQLLDIVVACGYLALYMQPWAAGIVFVTVSSYVPLTVCGAYRAGWTPLCHIVESGLATLTSSPVFCISRRPPPPHFEHRYACVCVHVP